MVRKDKEIFLDMSFWSVNKQKRVRVFDAYCILFNLRFFINLLLLVFRKHVADENIFLAGIFGLVICDARLNVDQVFLQEKKNFLILFEILTSRLSA